MDRRDFYQDILNRGIYFKRQEAKYYDQKTVEALGGDYIYQHPLQFAPFLEFLSDKTIDQYIEIGLSYGGTFVFIDEILRKNNPHLKSIAIDPKDCRLEKHKSYMNKYKDTITYLKMKSRNAQITIKDNSFCFIDGDHNIKSVEQDWEKYGKHTRFTAFHDITSYHVKGPKKLWTRLKSKHNCKEFIQSYPDKKNHFGIGLILNGNNDKK